MVNFANLPAATLISVCDFLKGDGHTTWKAGALLELLPKEYVESVMHTYESDTGSIKSTIFAPGHIGVPGDPVVPETTGVYGLSLYRRIARDLGLPGSRMGGRGFEARDLDRSIRAHLQEEEDEGVDYGQYANGHSPITYTGNA